jgi:RND family efflux transporter MFP subunit
MTRPFPIQQAVSRKQAGRRLTSLGSRRTGNAMLVTVVILCVVAVAALAGWWMFGSNASKAPPRVLVKEVSRGPYDYQVIEQGEVESASNIELKCEVRARGAGGSGGVTIIEIVPEGTMVEAGDIVVKLDSSALEQERVTQQIKVNSQESLLVQAQNTLEAAKIARLEYLEGTFKNEEKLILNEIFTAERALRTSQLAFNSAQRLAAKNLVTGLQLEGEQIAVDNARNSLEMAQSKLDVLRKYTSAKMLKTFDSDIATAEAKVGAEQSSLQLEQSNLAEIDDQISKCTIRAPSAGQVVYVNKYDSRGGSAEFVVEAGATVRERQPIIRLPNSNEMQIKATVNEARITLVRPGLPVTIRVDALKGKLLEGEVIRVNQYAEPGGWSSGNVKRYASYIKIKDPPPELRSGMNAEVRIHVERKSDVLQVPVQAVAEYKGHYFSLVKNGDNFETREVKVGSSNDTVVTINGGLSESEFVVMNPRSAGTLLQLPDDLPDLNPIKIADIDAPPEGNVALRPAAMAGGLGGPPAGGPPGGAGDKGSKKGRGNMSPSMLVDRYLQQDSDGDGKLSKDEVAQLDERGQQAIAAADTNSDGFLDRTELTAAAAAVVARMKERNAQGGPGGAGPDGAFGPGGTGGGE